MEELPEPLLFGISQGITVFAKGEIYKPSTKEGDGKDLITLDDVPFNLINLGGIRKVEELYREFEKSRIDAWQDKFLSSSQYDSSSLQKLEVENEIREFILEGIVPYFVSKGPFSKPGETHGEYTPKRYRRESKEPETLESESDARDPIAEFLAGKYGRRVIKEKTRLDLEEPKKRVTEGLSLLESILDRPTLIFDDLVYDLISRGKRDVAVVIDGKSYYPKNPRAFSGLKEQYIDLLKRRLKEEAAEDDPRLVDAIEKNERLDKELKSAIEGSDLSVVRDDYNVYYVCLAFPEFANIGEDGNFFRFPAGQIGVKLTYQGEKKTTRSRDRIKYDYPVVMEEYPSPFIDRFYSPRQKICLGGYSAQSSGNEAVVELLNIGRNVIMSGYFGNVGPYHRLDGGNFEKQITTEREAKRIGITNKRSLRRDGR